MLAVAGCGPDAATAPDGTEELFTPEESTFMDQALSLGEHEAMFCPTFEDCETVDIYDAKLAGFLISDRPGEDGFLFFGVSPDPDPGMVLDGSFQLRSGATLHRMTVTDELLADPDFGLHYWKSDDPNAGAWMSDETCILEDMDRMPEDGGGFVKMWLMGGSRKRDVMAYINCVKGLTAQARAANAKRTAEGQEPGCGVFVLEVWNDETSKWDLHASMLCPE
ncbi:MAG: hypothetical protein OXI79_08890 [Gammaproteobacteria bacterium]|nr:hypothetical protein [Gammaproteobacteria bacterium]